MWSVIDQNILMQHMTVVGISVSGEDGGKDWVEWGFFVCMFVFF